MWQWCSDRYGADYPTSSPERNPAGPASGQYHVLRDGSWGCVRGVVRAAVRYWDCPDDGGGDVGFRCARS